MWKDLSMQERAAYIKAAIKNGVYDRKDIIDRTNSFLQEQNNFAKGGPKQQLINRVNESKADFVQRLKDPNRKYIVNPDSTISTHRMAWATDNKGAIVYPEIQNINDTLVQLPANKALESAITRGDTVRMTPSQADWFTKNYKKYYKFDKGGHLYGYAGKLDFLNTLDTPTAIADNTAVNIQPTNVYLANKIREEQQEKENYVPLYMRHTLPDKEEVKKYLPSIEEMVPVVAGGAMLAASPAVPALLPIGLSFLGGEAVNQIAKASTGKTWEQNVSNTVSAATNNKVNLDNSLIGQVVTGFTNPGYLLNPTMVTRNIPFKVLSQQDLYRKGVKQATKNINASVENKEVLIPILEEKTTTPVTQNNFSKVSTALNNKVAPAISTIEPYQIADLGGGYMLKSLMRGNPLEKQISKQGTVNVNNVKALISKGSKVEQAVVDKVLTSEEFAEKKSIDYNKFRKAVQDELITYNRTPDTRYENYGGEALNWGGSDKDIKEWALSTGNYIIAPWDKNKPSWKISSLIDKRTGEEKLIRRDLEPLYKKEYGVTLNTYTFSSPRIPNGSSKHYDANTLGHSRTYTTADEPNVLHVMESQSDWGQSAIKIDKNNDIEYLRRLLSDKKGGFERNKQFFSKNQFQLYLSDIQELEDHISRLEKIGDAKMQASYLHDNYASRQIQENLRYAAEKGQKKMRYPTRETAAKIEGYPEREAYFDASGKDVTKERVYTYGEKEDARLDEINKELRRIENERDSDYWQHEPEFIEKIRKKDDKLYTSLISEQLRIKSAGPRLKPGITKKTVYDYENILRKYTEFPKQYQKLYKGADVRTVTDTKGNTWYEVDVPENYLKKEWQYADGGLLGEPDLTPLDLAAYYENNKANGNRRIDTTMMRNIDNVLIKSNVNKPQRQSIAMTFHQEGSTIGPHGNGASGLLGWRSTRAKNLPTTLQGQVEKIYNETYGDFDSNNWTDGGKGSGYNTGREAQEAFKNAQTLEEAVKALNFGYVRPGYDETMRRIKAAKKLFGEN